LTMKQGRKYEDPKSVHDIAHFVEMYNLNMDEILAPSVDEYKTFNEFFYRKLKPSARPIFHHDNPRIAVSAADCRLNVFVDIKEATEVWIKGKNFSLANLFKDRDLASKFDGGSIVIHRLAPQDYHRFHAPISGTLLSLAPYQGCYYTVNPIAVTEHVDVFTDNKRVVGQIDSPEFGLVAFVAVGATMVASINFTVDVGATFSKGDELGYFAFGGSTTIVVFQEGKIQYDEDLLINSHKPLETLVQMGDSLGRAI